MTCNEPKRVSGLTSYRLLPKRKIAGIAPDTTHWLDDWLPQSN